MRDYYVHFSYYSEEWGNFDDISYPVTAETSFEAREKAWLICDQDSDTLFRKNIRQFAVTWKPNLLDAGDYFYSHAADIKQALGRLMNVAIPNDRIANNERQHQLDTERCSHLSALYTLDDVAKDLYADKGILPPSVHEELHYAEKLYEHLDYGEKAEALWERIDRARKWDRGAVYSIRDLFKDGYTTLCGEAVFFNELFGRNGIYPVHNNLDEHDYMYISRWNNRMKIDSLKRLPLLKETDIIPNSAGNMSYDYQTLLLDRSNFADDRFQAPENMLWEPTDPTENGEVTKDGIFTVRNIITDEHISTQRNFFFGVLRPDIAATFDFDSLKNEYALAYGENGIKDRLADDFSYDVGLDDDEDELEL